MGIDCDCSISTASVRPPDDELRKRADLLTPPSADRPDPDEVGQEFERIFLSFLIKELRIGELSQVGGESVPGSGVYEGLLVNALSEQIARSRAFGIAEAVQAYVEAQGPGEAKRPIPSITGGS